MKLVLVGEKFKQTASYTHKEVLISDFDVLQLVWLSTTILGTQLCPLVCRGIASNELNFVDHILYVGADVGLRNRFASKRVASYRSAVVSTLAFNPQSFIAYPRLLE